MFIIFTRLADLIVYRLVGLAAETRAAESLHFFIEDVSKIFAMVTVMIYLIALLRAGMNTEKLRDFLSGKTRAFGYVAASALGGITPFCSCSSIPLFLGFTQARIPLGITMAFLITSPIVNEVALVLLGGILGIRFMLIYLAIGLAAGILGGFFLDSIGAERYLTPLVEGVRKSPGMDGGSGSPATATKLKLGMRERHLFAKDELRQILGRIWKWVLIGIGAGALLHGFVPEEFITERLGSNSFWSVPAAVLLGIPLYSNASGMVPIAESLLGKGLPVGTTMAFMMNTVAASFPEFMLLKQVMKPRLLVIFFLMLLFFFTLAGWILNGVQL
jgi:uncharacterized protein